MQNPCFHQHRCCPTVSSRCLGHRRCSRPRRPTEGHPPCHLTLEMHYFLKDFTTNSAGMHVHADETQCATM